MKIHNYMNLYLFEGVDKKVFRKVSLHSASAACVVIINNKVVFSLNVGVGYKSQEVSVRRNKWN